jgi:Tol biopolymer transport system component
VYRTDAQGFTVWTVDVDRGILTRVLGEGNPHAPVWSPDGERLAFSQDHEGTSNVFVQAADGAGTAELLVASAQHGDPGSWSRDGRWIVYTEASSDTDWDLWALDVPAHRARPFRRAPRAQQQPTISPDGQWVAYASNETGTFQVYVEAFPSGGKRIQISPEGGTEPLWTSSGRELIYRNQHRLMSVGVSPGATLSVTKPVQVLDASFLAAATYGPPAYAIAPDGRSFYFIEPKAQPATPRRINIVLGWVDELERRMGGRAQR